MGIHLTFWLIIRINWGAFRNREFWNPLPTSRTGLSPEQSNSLGHFHAKPDLNVAGLDQNVLGL